MLRIYCDTGAYRLELKKLEGEGVIEVLQFKYENRNRHITKAAPPTNPTYKQMNYSWAKMKSDPLLSKVTYDSIGETSEKFQEILAVVGRSNLNDAKNIDSAFRASCNALLTSDKDDILSNKEAIRQITGIEVFHSVDDWQALLSFIANHVSGGEK